MGCGCKKNKTVENSTINSNGITLGGIIKMSILIVLFITISPIILILIWIIGINTIIGGNFNIFDSIIKLISKKKNIPEDDEEELNVEDLELLDVDIIK